MRALWLAVAVWICSAASGWARSSPLDYTHATLDRARAIVSSDRQHDDKLAALAALFRKFLDTDLMGRQALGPHWSSLSSEQQKEFLVLFGELMERTYVAKLLLFEQPDFAYLSQTPLSDGETRVDTSIITPRDTFVVVYRLRPDGDRWRATGIIVEGVSLTANLGSQLDHLLSRLSIRDLLDLMRRKYGPREGG